MEKRDILLQLIQYYANGNKAKFARYLDVPAVNVSAWITRNKFDENFISTKCKEINPAFLVTGEGPMLREGEPAPVPKQKKEESINDYKTIINELLAIISVQSDQINQALETIGKQTNQIDHTLEVINNLTNNHAINYMVAEEPQRDNE